MGYIEGSYGILTYPGVPGSGTNEVQTITIGGTPTAGTFTLTFQGATTAPITWSNVNATLVAAIDAALEALPNVGTGNVATAAGTLTAGIGTITLTFGGTLGNSDVGPVTATSALTGTSPTIAVAVTTPGAEAGGRGAPKGALVIDTANGALYQNTGTAASPTWTAR